VSVLDGFLFLLTVYAIVYWLLNCMLVCEGRNICGPTYVWCSVYRCVSVCLFFFVSVCLRVCYMVMTYVLVYVYIMYTSVCARVCTTNHSGLV